MNNNDEFEITYEIADGYCGKNAPQKFTVNIGDFADDMSIDEAEELIIDMMQEHFLQNIYPYQTNKEKFRKWFESLKWEEDEDLEKVLEGL